VLNVKARAMPRDGWEIYRSGDGMWLVEHIPSRYLSGRRSGV
jgi:RNA:NAD 2'-phosphotransferase (TPT1/KptA family)